jgi:hypothetical protein
MARIDDVGPAPAQTMKIFPRLTLLAIEKPAGQRRGRWTGCECR